MSTPRFLVVDKPVGVTSHDVVAVVRAITGEKKVGHTGTLDPFATGALALALGPATRLVQYLDESVKIYDMTIQLGAATDTGDPTGTVILEAPVPALEVGQVEEVLAGFVGDRMQRPPAYSAVKLNGRPLYSYARQGEQVEVPARPITVRDLRLVSLEGSALRVMLTCSRGTYARVLAEEIGVALGTCGHLSALSRVRTGPFHLDDALTMPQLGEIVALEPGRTWQDVLLAQGRPRDQRPRWRSRQDVLEALRPFVRPALACLGHLPLVDVPDSELQRARSGTLPSRLPPGLRPGGRYLVVNGAEIVAVADIGPRGPRVVCGLGGEA